MQYWLIATIMGVLEPLGRWLAPIEPSYALLFARGLERTRWLIGKWRALLVFHKARRLVPAYQQFLEGQDIRIGFRGLDPDLTAIPPTDKENYVKRYSLEQRCQRGRIPRAGVMIDESSGSSGVPNNWVRGPEERAAVREVLQVSVHHLVGTKQFLFINAFALGPWATGMNVSMSLVDICVLKSTGPDISKIVNTLRLFGPRYRYIIAGYPPFLKALVDSAEVDWAEYECIAFYGGEGISEPMREYLGKAFSGVYGSYGASDLEINLAAENPFTIALRQRMVANPVLHAALARHATLPMVFQFNPMEYHIETSEEGELLVTLCRPSNVSPKVRYNIHDLGHVVRIPELKTALGQCGLTLADIGELETELPLLLHYGRADLAVAFYGCKITPAEMEGALFSLPQVAPFINSFALITHEDEQLNKRLTLALELPEEVTVLPAGSMLSDPAAATSLIFDKLRQQHQDFRESSSMVPAGLEPTVEVYAAGTGPFQGQDIRVKRRYIQQRD